jgi:8-oxo-dGTP pyrophosphatase MutT (NUDIX family)
MIESRERVGQVGATGLYAVTVRRQDGTRKVVAEVRRPDAVAVLPVLVTSAGVRMGLFVRQAGPVVGVPDLWEVPGGAVDPGEDPAQAAVRELREETGYVVTALAPLAERLWVSPGYTTERMDFFAVTVAEETVPPRGEAAHVLADWWPLNRVPTQDMKTVLAVLFAQRDTGLWTEVAGR